jgi:hypothetical protein
MLKMVYKPLATSERTVILNSKNACLYLIELSFVACVLAAGYYC